MNDSFYQILGIPTDADERQIKRAYHRLARELHPDKAETPEKGKELEKRFALVSTAYNVLKDPKLRKAYDEKMGVQGPALSAPAGTATAAVMGTRTPPPPGAQRPTDGGQGQRRKTEPIGTTPERAGIAQKAYARGISLMKAKDPAKAAEFFEAAIANNEAEAHYHARLASALIQAKKSASRAIAAAERAIELDKYNLEYKFNLGQIYETIGSTSNAIKVYDEILRWEPENSMAQQLLRNINRKNGSLLNRLTASSPVLAMLRKKISK